MIYHYAIKIFQLVNHSGIILIALKYFHRVKMSINWKRDEVKERSSHLLDTIVALTMADNVVTPDEEELVNVIREQIYSFEAKFSSIVERQLNLEEATAEVTSIFEEVITIAANKAKEDGTITSDELILNEDISKYLT